MACQNKLEIKILLLLNLLCHQIFDPAMAVIVWDDPLVGGDIKKIDVKVEYFNPFVMLLPSRKMVAFDEKQNVTLTRDIRIAAKNPSHVEYEDLFANYSDLSLDDSNLIYDWDADYSTNPELEMCTVVNSHFIGFKAHELGEGNPYAVANATIVFKHPIIGLIDTRDTTFSDDLFAFNKYYQPKIRGGTTLEGLEWGEKRGHITERDHVKITGDNRNILELRLSTVYFEGLRVLTKAPDTPESIKCKDNKLSFFIFNVLSVNFWHRLFLALSFLGLLMLGGFWRFKLMKSKKKLN